MGVEFDTRFKHPWSMIVSGSSSSVKTVFTIQLVNKSDKQYIGSIPYGKTDTKIVTPNTAPLPNSAVFL